MGLMNELLAAVGRNPGATVEEITEATGYTETQVRSNMIHAVNRKLATRGRDEVTHRPSYHLTDDGRALAGIGKNDDASEVAAPKEEPAILPDVKTGPGPQEQHDNMLLGVIADIRKAIGDPEGKIMLGDLAEQIQRAYQLGDAHRAACAEWERSMLEATGHDSAPSAISAIRVIESALAIERQARQALQEQIDADPGVDVKDAATGYVMLASKRKPRRLAKPENAREAALSAIRAGAQRAEVFALVPVGKAVRGAQWRDA